MVNMHKLTNMAEEQGGRGSGQKPARLPCLSATVRSEPGWAEMALKRLLSPSWTAKCRAVLPLQSAIPTPAPEVSSAWAAAPHRPRTARCRAVKPCRVVASASLPACTTPSHSEILQYISLHFAGTLGVLPKSHSPIGIRARPNILYILAFWHLLQRRLVAMWMTWRVHIVSFFSVDLHSTTAHCHC